MIQVPRNKLENYLVINFIKLLQVPSWDFNDTVIKTGLKASSGGVGDGVLQLREGYV